MLANRVQWGQAPMVFVPLLVLVLFPYTTWGQQQIFPKGLGFTPNPLSDRLKHPGQANNVPKHKTGNEPAGGMFPGMRGQRGDRPIQSMYQDTGRHGQLARRPSQNHLKQEQPPQPPQPVNLNYSKPNLPPNNRNVNNIVQDAVKHQLSDMKPNLLVNQNPIQESPRHLVNKSAGKNVFKAGSDTVVNKPAEQANNLPNQRPVNTVKEHSRLNNNEADANKANSPLRPAVVNLANNVLAKPYAIPEDLFDKNSETAPKPMAVNSLPKNSVYTNSQTNGGGVPLKVKYIDGEVEAKAGGDTQDREGIADDNNEDEEEDEEDEEDDEEEDEEYEGEDREDVNTNNNNNNNNNRFKDPYNRQDERRMDLDNANRRENMNNQVINDNVFHANGQYPDNVNGVPNMESVLRTDTNKQGSLKVVWDWTDFAVNFEQYVMPEQKIRRAPHATTGEPWPLPQYYVAKPDKVYRIDKSNFRFKLSKIRCDVIEKALERYKDYMLEDAVEDMYDNFQHAQGTMFEDPSQKYETPLYLEAPVLSIVFIKIRKPCSRYPTAKMDESYDLFVKRTGIHVMANEVWGALRGLETLSQIVFKGTNQLLYIKDTVINDFPRFSHRGILVDSSRHFMFKETIYDILEGMAQNKMNVLHWHIVDDQSFPFYSSAFPDLSGKGAFHPSFVYMPEDVADIIEFARLRGIRVEPEFDTPGHTYSWGLSRPDLLTQCYQGERPVEGYLGPMDPSKNETFRFLKTFFKDVMTTFKDEFLHLGGDEVPMTCWQSNPEVMKFLAKLEGRKSESPANDPYYYSYDIRKVLEYYVNRLITDLKSVGSKRNNGVRFVFWQEIMNNNVQLPNDTVIHVWQGGMEDVQRATSQGLNVIYSTCWYLDQIEYGTKWSKYYQCDPVDMSYGYTIDEKKVLGGEACLWAEYIENENAMTLLWPRASATAERLWSNKDVKDLETAASRLQEHRCRMLSRGLGIGQISGPDYCLKRGKRRWHFNETSTNCTQCGSYSENSRVEVEKIKVEFEQKGGHISDCSQAVIQAGGQLTIALLIIIVIAVAITLKVTKQKINQVRVCRNKTILLVFITLILVYFMCYTSIWMQAMQFKGSFEKRISSNVAIGT